MNDIEGYIQEELTNDLEWEIVQRFICAEYDVFKDNNKLSEVRYDNELKFAENDIKLILAGKKAKYNRKQNLYQGLIYQHSFLSFLWEKLILETANAGYGYFSFYCLYKCNWLLSHKESKNKDANNLSYDFFEKFLEKLEKNDNLLKKFVNIKPFILNSDIKGSKEFNKLIDFFQQNLPDIKSFDNNINTTSLFSTGLEEVSGGKSNVKLDSNMLNTNISGQQNKISGKENSGIKTNTGKETNTELSFLKYIFPDFLIEYTKKFEANQFEKADKYLQDISRRNEYPEPYEYYRFLIRLLRIQCYYSNNSSQIFSLLEKSKSEPKESKLEIQLKEKILPTLISLWLDVLPLKSEDTDLIPRLFEFGKHYPVLYSKLIDLTLLYMKIINNDYFKIGQNNVLSKDLLQSHLAIIMWN